MKRVFPDWRAQGVTACLHEHQGGFAFNHDSVLGLAGKCAEEGVEILTGVEVRAIELGADGTAARRRDEPRPDRRSASSS